MIRDSIPISRAVVTARHFRNGVLLSERIVRNVVTKVGIDFIVAQSYGIAPLANGLNYIALSDDTFTETADSIALSAEISSNGLSRAQGAVAHAPGTSKVTVSKTFTATGAQGVKKVALFSAASLGTMNHPVALNPQLSLEALDTLQIIFEITFEQD